MDDMTPIWDLPDVPKGVLPEHIELQRSRVVCNFDAPINTENIQFSGAFALMGVDNSVTLHKFQQNFKVEVISLTETDMEFDLIGIDASLANAFRRILLSEIPTMAIERIFVANNTSLVQDEVLAHRLCLVPLNADPKLFEDMEDGVEPNERNTIVFHLHASCEKGGSRLSVKTDALKWLPNGSEFELETEKSAIPTEKPKTYTSFGCSQDSFIEFSDKPIAPTNPNIVLAKLGPGQEIELEAHAIKGIGQTHAKWSPVATTWYRMLPEVVFLKDVEGKRAEELVKKCPADVFDIEDLGKGKKKARVKNARSCTLCRECIREGDMDQYVSLRRVKDHFIFTIESTGALPPEVLFTEAVKVLEKKCEKLIDELV